MLYVLCFTFKESFVQVVKPKDDLLHVIVVCTKQGDEWVDVTDKFGQQPLKHLPDPLSC